MMAVTLLCWIYEGHFSVLLWHDRTERIYYTIKVRSLGGLIYVFMVSESFESRTPSASLYPKYHIASYVAEPRLEDASLCVSKMIFKYASK